MKSWFSDSLKYCSFIRYSCITRIDTALSERFYRYARNDATNSLTNVYYQWQVRFHAFVLSFNWIRDNSDMCDTDNSPCLTRVCDNCSTIFEYFIHNSKMIIFVLQKLRLPNFGLFSKESTSILRLECKHVPIHSRWK